MTKPARLMPYVGFNLNEVSLYMVPLNEERRQRHLMIKLPRCNDGEACPNVRLIRAMERAAVHEMAAQVEEGLRADAAGVFRPA